MGQGGAGTKSSGGAGQQLNSGHFQGRAILKIFRAGAGQGSHFSRRRGGAGHASLTYFANLAIIQHWLDKMAKNNHLQEMASSQTTQSALSNKTLIDNADVLKKISCA